MAKMGWLLVRRTSARAEEPGASPSKCADVDAVSREPIAPAGADALGQRVSAEPAPSHSGADQHDFGESPRP